MQKSIIQSAGIHILCASNENYYFFQHWIHIRIHFGDAILDMHMAWHGMKAFEYQTIVIFTFRSRSLVIKSNDGDGQTFRNAYDFGTDFKSHTSNDYCCFCCNIDILSGAHCILLFPIWWFLCFHCIKSSNLNLIFCKYSMHSHIHWKQNANINHDISLDHI